MIPEIEEYGIYKHYEGKIYVALGKATNTETLEEMVVYQRLWNQSLFCDPLKNFFEPVTIDGISVERFRYLGNWFNEDNDEKIYYEH